MIRDAVIVDVVRTPSGRGKPGGALSGVHPVDLAAGVLRSVLARNGLESTQVDDVLMGCVSQIGDQAMNIARQAVLAAGFDATVPAATIDRQCGSSQQAAHFAAQGVIAGAYDIVIAAGVESMSRVPLGSSRTGGSLSRGIAERYPEGLVNQGVSAELIAHKWGFSREELDAFSAESHRRAADAAAQGRFDSQLLPVDHRAAASVDARRDGPRRHDGGGARGTQPGLPHRRARRALPRPRVEHHARQFVAADGCRIRCSHHERGEGRRTRLTPRARFHSFAVVGDDPLFMLTGPIPATRRILERSGLSIDDIDAYEVNEAFASVPLAWAKELGADPAKLNPWGGAIALGHAVGASGTRLLGTLVAHLEATGGRYGLQTMCEGGGMANATIIERL